MKIVIVAGTRPEVVKLSPVYGALRSRGGLEPIWLSTEQQGELNSQTLEIMGVQPDLRLAPPTRDRSLGARFAEMMERLDGAFERLTPDLVLVQGDTSSTAAAAMAAFSQRIPIGHVEAGLRTFDLSRPFPEEGWRCVVGQLAAHHFAPTQAAAENLIRSGVSAGKIHITGNTGIDSVRLAAGRAGTAPRNGGLRRVLVTLHRRENWDSSLDQVLAALTDIRDRVEDVELVFVAHANPELRYRAEFLLRRQPRIRVVGALDYLSFLAMMKSACLILSDSGGVQEEAPAVGVPNLVLRNSTERMEAVEAGVAKLVGVDRETVASAAIGLLTDEARRLDMVRAVSLFGDGHASERIADILSAQAAGGAPPIRMQAL